MKRRDFVSVVSAVGALSSVGLSPISLQGKEMKNVIKPKHLRRGSRIGVVAPATNVSDPDDFRKMQEVADYFGFELVVGKSLSASGGYKTKNKSVRLSDLHSFFDDDTIDGIFCIRGGYGSAALLDDLEYEMIAANPKAFVGYSDITAMHLAFQKKCSFVSFHGPVLLSAFTGYTSEYFQRVLGSTERIGLLENPKQMSGIRKSFPTRTISSGKTTGILTGGNLSLISSLMGTPYEIDTEGAVLFLEDVGEEPYRVDRMLQQLKSAGKLDKASGFVLGQFADAQAKSLPPSFDFALGEVLDYHFTGLGKPCFYGLMIGHTPEQITLPMSLEVEMDADMGTIYVNDSAVI